MNNIETFVIGLYLGILLGFLGGLLFYYIIRHKSKRSTGK